MGEGVSNLPAVVRAWALPASLESICPDHFLVCVHTEAEQVWGVPVFLSAALHHMAFSCVEGEWKCHCQAGCTWPLRY